MNLAWRENTVQSIDVGAQVYLTPVGSVGHLILPFHLLISFSFCRGHITLLSCDGGAVTHMLGERSKGVIDCSLTDPYLPNSGFWCYAVSLICFQLPVVLTEFFCVSSLEAQFLPLLVSSLLFFSDKVGME